MSVRTPPYRLHKPTGQAAVTLSGRDFYLGKHGTPESRGEYDRLIAEWLANGRQLAPSTDATVSELMVGYIKHADAYYVKDGGSISVRHQGGPDFHDRVTDATFQIMDEAPKTMAAIERWKGIELAPPQREAVAAAALELKENHPVSPVQLLAPRRSEDRKTDLWTTASVVQEHLHRGGDLGRASTGRRTTTRPVKCVGEDLRLNQALWTLTERLAQLVS